MPCYFICAYQVGRINFLQMGRYGKFSEQTYRNNFAKEGFDLTGFNMHLSEKVLTGSRKAYAIDPSYKPKSGRFTPWIGKFWSGVAGAVKRGLEIMGIALIDVENRDSITIRAKQSPDSVTLDNIYQNLISWYSGVLIQGPGAYYRVFIFNEIGTLFFKNYLRVIRYFFIYLRLWKRLSHQTSACARFWV